jgi:ankyrin repeat protein
VNAPGGTYNYPLQAAAVGRSTETVRFLLEAGANVNARGEFWGTALQAASAAGNINIVRLLLERDADPNIKGGYCGSSFVAAVQGYHLDLLQILLDAGAEVPEGEEWDSIYKAVKEAEIRLMKGEASLWPQVNLENSKAIVEFLDNLLLSQQEVRRAQCTVET